MNIRKEIEELCFNKYGLKVNDPFSIKSQAIKFMEEYREYEKAIRKDNIEQIECEIGDMLFVCETLKILSNFNEKEHKFFPLFDSDDFYKKINKCDISFLMPMIKRTNTAFFKYKAHRHNEVLKFGGTMNIWTIKFDDLLQQTILKNQGRSGKIINGCYVKSEDI